MEKWVFPCSVKFFNVIEHFSKNEIIAWKKVHGINLGDIVYIYVGAPYSEIKYKCVVVDMDLDKEVMKNHSYAVPTNPVKEPKYIMLKLDKVYNNEKLKFSNLKDKGLGQVPKQVRADRRMCMYINRIESEGGLNNE